MFALAQVINNYIFVSVHPVQQQQQQQQQICDAWWVELGHSHSHSHKLYFSQIRYYKNLTYSYEIKSAEPINFEINCVQALNSIYKYTTLF